MLYFYMHSRALHRKMGPLRRSSPHVLLLIVCSLWSGSAALAQRFVKLRPILHDSVPIVLEGGIASHGFPPLHGNCVRMVVPVDVVGKVLVEFVGASDKGFACFYGYACYGQLYACFPMQFLDLVSGQFHYEGRLMEYVTLRRPP